MRPIDADLFKKGLEDAADSHGYDERDSYDMGVYHTYLDVIDLLDEQPTAQPDNTALRKAARKLAWIHQQIDLYDDRPELHEEDYWMDYLTDPEWDDPDIRWYSGTEE